MLYVIALYSDTWKNVRCINKRFFICTATNLWALKFPWNVGHHINSISTTNTDTETSKTTCQYITFFCLQSGDLNHATEIYRARSKLKLFEQNLSGLHTLAPIWENVKKYRRILNFYGGFYRYGALKKVMTFLSKQVFIFFMFYFKYKVSETFRC